MLHPGHWMNLLKIKWWVRGNKRILSICIAKYVFFSIPGNFWGCVAIESRPLCIITVWFFVPYKKSNITCCTNTQPRPWLQTLGFSPYLRVYGSGSSLACSLPVAPSELNPRKWTNMSGVAVFCRYWQSKKSQRLLEFEGIRSEFAG